MKICAYDIETIGRPMSDEAINAFCKTGNLKDPVKIEAKRAEARSRLGKEPLTAMPCCGGWYSSDADQGCFILMKDSEEGFLSDYLAKLSEYDVLVGFNCFSFDSKILTLRSAVHGVEMPFRFDRKKYSSGGNHIDLRMVLQDWNAFEHGTLGFFLDMFGLGGKGEGIDGSMVQGMWDAGERAEIGEYCVRDCKRTFQLFEKLSGYFT